MLGLKFTKLVLHAPLHIKSFSASQALAHQPYHRHIAHICVEIKLSSIVDIVSFLPRYQHYVMFVRNTFLPFLPLLSLTNGTSELCAGTDLGLRLGF